MNIPEILQQMTLEEKARMLSGRDFWHFEAVERLGVPAVMVADGPHGLRKEVDNTGNDASKASVPATAFPTAAALACSFDRELVGQVGEALGELCQEEDVAVILGPGTNIKRSPLCGRNFEYFSEDPLLAGELAAAHINGVQSRDIGTSLKHFMLNNQENRRLTVSAEVDERTCREIYMTPFEIAVKKGKPWTVMCSYNKIGGVYASENKALLTDLLRDEWGFEGVTITDWGACNDHAAGVAAGMDVVMPSIGEEGAREIVDAVNDGRLDIACVDAAVTRILKLADRYTATHKKDPDFFLGVQHHLARKVARECAVLLKNDGTLPLASKGNIAFIGAFAEAPRYQGGGSSHVNPYEMTSALEAVRSVCKVSYAKGYQTETDTVDEALEAEAVKLASESDVAVMFVGLPDAFESEGYDRKHMEMPNCQNRLIEKVAEVCKKVVIVLHNGSPITMPWLDKVNAVLEMYLGGQAVGAAAVDLLFGAVSPSGKLAETFPLRLEDNPSYLNFPGDDDIVRYAEGMYVGYRWYDARKMDVRYPFGHGLSYTTFKYDNVRVEGTDPVMVSVDVTNTGRMGAKEIVQCYVHDCAPVVSKPVNALCGFEKIYIAPGKTVTVTIPVERRAYSHYDVKAGRWVVDGGEYELSVGASSRDLRGSVKVAVAGDKVERPVTLDTTVMEMIRATLGTQKETIAKKLLEVCSGVSENGALSETLENVFMADLPLHSLRGFSGGKLSMKDIREMVAAANAKDK
ncbi:MAG: glycoside hydrolase family 3 C-terminal domain-containing protein [Clostridia bacterium]|nr:glycoside hydrolase family 3 C-terminal domain-containing protein [Clostridia bacterium]